MTSSWSRGGPNQIKLVSLGKVVFWTQAHTGRTPRKDEDRDWDDTGTQQGIPKRQQTS